MEYNKEYWIEQLKKEVGLEDVSYEDLVNYKVDFTSILGEGEQVNAKEYVDNQLENIKKGYDEVAYQESENDGKGYDLPSVAELNVNKGVRQLENKMATTDPDKYRYFSMGGNVFVTVYDNEDKLSQQQITDILVDTHFVGEIPREDLSGLEIIVSYYQYMNHVQEQQRLNPVEDFLKRMNTEFDGVKLDGFTEKKEVKAPFNFYLVAFGERRLVVTVPNVAPAATPVTGEINHNMVVKHWSYVGQVEKPTDVIDAEVISYFKFINEFYARTKPGVDRYADFCDSKSISGFEDFDFSTL